MSAAPNGAAPDGATVIIVDDSAVSLRVLERALLDLPGVEVKAFKRPEQALDAFRQGPCDLLITDYEMPQMSGLELIQACRAEANGVDVPMMVVTISFDRELRNAALKLGAVDFLTKPIDADEVRARARNMVALGRAHRKLADHSRWLTEEVTRATLGVVQRERETILRLSFAAEYRDWETGKHIQRVAETARHIALKLQLPSETCDQLMLAAPLHDVGKIGVPDFILRKPDRLDAGEFLVMQQHTVIGHRILADSQSPLLRLGAEIALTHHEKFDGTGYPNGIAGAAIPLSGRIVAVADVFDAVTSRRPYKLTPWAPAEAKAHVLEHAGTQFDPAVVQAFKCAWDVILDTNARLSDNPVVRELVEEVAIA